MVVANSEDETSSIRTPLIAMTTGSGSMTSTKTRKRRRRTAAATAKERRTKPADNSTVEGERTTRDGSTVRQIRHSNLECVSETNHCIDSCMLVMDRLNHGDASVYRVTHSV